MNPRIRPLIVGLLLGMAGSAIGPPAVAAQEPAVPDTAAPSPRVEEGISPGGAFLRSLVLPGWGHAAVGSHTRGGFYFLAEAATGAMLIRSLDRQDRAERIVGLRRSRVEADLIAEGHAPDSIALLADAHPEVVGAESFLEARSQQVEDWAALGLFLLFLGAADAFVSAHLQDFPEPLDATVGLDGSAEIRVSIPVGPPH